MNPENEIGALEFEPVAACRLLYPLARPAGSRRVPAAFEAVEAMDALARSAYDAGDYTKAAALFMEVAAGLRLPAGEPHAETFLANRALAYANAAAAWSMAGLLHEARRALGEAAANDPDCGEAIGQLLRDLN